MADMSAQSADLEDRMTLADRTAQAYNIFQQTHGYNPGDVTTASALEGLSQKQALDPIAVQQAQSTLAGTNLENTGKQQSNAFAAQSDPLKLQEQQDVNKQTEQNTAFAAQKQPGEVAQQAATLAGTKASTAETGARIKQQQYETSSAMSSSEQQAALGMANQLLAVRNSGGDVNAAFEEMAPRIEAMPGVEKSHIEGMRANVGRPGFLENLAGQLGNTTLAQKGMVKLPNSDGSGYSFVPSSSVPKAAPGVQSYFDVKTRQVGQRTVQQTQSPQAINIAKADLGQMDLQYDRTAKVIDKAIGQVSNASAGFGAETIGRLPASQTKALQASIDAAKGNIALLTANLARQGNKNGASAVPVRNMQEFKAYQDALGAVNVNASPTVVRQQLQAVKTNLAALQGAVHDKYKATYGDGVSATAAANSAPAPGGVVDYRTYFGGGK